MYTAGYVLVYVTHGPRGCVRKHISANQWTMDMVEGAQEYLQLTFIFRLHLKLSNEMLQYIWYYRGEILDRK